MSKTITEVRNHLNWRINLHLSKHLNKRLLHQPAHLNKLAIVHNAERAGLLLVHPWKSTVNHLQLKQLVIRKTMVSSTEDYLRQPSYPWETLSSFKTQMKVSTAITLRWWRRESTALDKPTSRLLKRHQSSAAFREYGQTHVTDTLLSLTLKESCTSSVATVTTCLSTTFTLLSYNENDRRLKKQYSAKNCAHIIVILNKTL